METRRIDYRFLISPWSEQFIEAVSRTRHELFISSPFVNAGGTRTLAEAIGERTTVSLTLITSLTTENIVNGITDPSALHGLYGKFGCVRISSLERLHAKVYVIDGKIGIITSANLTSGGLETNFEYGVMITDEEVISTMREDMNHYYSLGNVLDQAVLSTLQRKADEIGRLRTQRERAFRESRLTALIERSAREIEFELLRNRIRKGRTVNAILSETMLYFLAKKGSLSTQELHSFIQPMHPDICDDSVDRVIDGQHFGKRWKHLVRDAQQYLKRRGLIKLERERWHLTRPTMN